VSSRGLAKGMVWTRRLVQAACLILFLYLFWSVGLQDPNSTEPPSRFLFLDLDPLAWLWTTIAARAVTFVPWLVLVTVVVTLLLGRVFCGWVCPLGTVHAVFTWSRRYLRAKRLQNDGWSPWQRGKYYALAGFLILALLGVQWVGVFDPICVLYRSVATALYPGMQYSVEEGAGAIYDADPHAGPLHLKAISEPVYQFLRSRVFQWRRQVFSGGGAILLFFIAIVLLNLYKPRFWCRYLCPLGGLLGVCSQRPVLRLESSEKCTECGLCARQCPAAADPDKPNQWRATECYGCWNCVKACNRNAISFKFKSPIPAPSEAKLDLSKRAVLSAGVGGAAGLVLFRLPPAAQGRIYNPELIRPPGSRAEAEFLARCIRCGLCMKVCPTNGLQPTGLEAGLEGIWSPMLVPRVGYCEYNCNLCGQVCPTGAIEKLALEAKQKVKMGLATVDRTRCLPYAYNRECLICEEHCPVSKKAIYFVPAELELRDGRTITQKQPCVDPDLCIGCGICENVCVLRDRPAIRVTSANETRHSGNRAILPGFSEPLPEPAEPSESNPYQ